jgi:SH3-like domain-containing protein
MLTLQPAAFTAAGGTAAAASPPPGTSVGPSGLPLPRFVSLKASRVNLRIGPGLNYAIDWMYLKSGLPMEIIQEYDNWRRVRDADGTEGWINQSLLSGERTGVVTPWQRGKAALVPLRAEADNESRLVAEVEPGAIGTISMCNGDWCRMDFGAARGWLRQSAVWGAYPGETIAE